MGAKPTMKALLTLPLAYAGLLFASCRVQDRLLFHPDRLAPDHDFQLSSPDAEVALRAADGVPLSAILFTRPGSQRAIIYLHGNAGSLASWKDVARGLTDLGCDVLVIDYRGYGKSGGRFSERGFYEDGEAAYAFMKARGWTDDRLVFYGRSLGTGVATELALRHPVAGLILESPFTSLLDIAAEKYWFLLPRLYLRYRFDSLAKAPRIAVPVLLLHGTADALIPVAHAERLSTALRSPHTLVALAGGGHNDLGRFPERRQALAAFLASLR
jgi:fermentation-respiration switch protein FrsA (DUF1100 family)